VAFVLTTPPAAATPASRPDDVAAGAGAVVRAGGRAAVRARAKAIASLPAHVLLALLALVSVYPIYWMFVTAFRPSDDSLSTNPLPGPVSLENFAHVWEQIPIGSMLASTFGMAITLSAAQLLVAILASYGFARWSFRGKKVLYLLFVGSWLVPFQVTMIPNYLLVSQMGLLNTVMGVVLPQLCSAFGVMMLRQHLESFPKELLDAAQMDGRSTWQALWQVVVPNLRPALAALAIMLFISAWNEYLWPTLIMQKSQALIQVGIRAFLGAEGNNWGAIMAASAIACLPIFLIYIFLQRYVVDAFVRSGIK
jgi:ABC-type glycerol-3-phosphate transport system permease component